MLLNITFSQIGSSVCENGFFFRKPCLKLDKNVIFDPKVSKNVIDNKYN